VLRAANLPGYVLLDFEGSSHGKKRGSGSK
jgi:hypothetical protein